MSPAGLEIPFRRTANEIADADEENQNDDAVEAKFVSGIYDGDCAPDMDLNGNKLSSDPAKQVPESKLGNDAVSARVLADAVSDANDASRAVTRDHIRNQAINKSKVSVQRLSQAFNLSVPGASTGLKYSFLVTLSTALNTTSHTILGVTLQSISGTPSPPLSSAQPIGQLIADGAGTYQLAVHATQGVGGYTLTGTAIIDYLV